MRDPVISARVPRHVKESLQDIGIKEILVAVYRGLDDGSLNWDGRVLTGSLDTSDFERACERVKRRPSDVLRAITEQIS